MFWKIPALHRSGGWHPLVTAAQIESITGAIRPVFINGQLTNFVPHTFEVFSFSFSSFFLITFLFFMFAFHVLIILVGCLISYELLPFLSITSEFRFMNAINPEQ